jgi:hypothetical protein
VGDPAAPLDALLLGIAANNPSKPRFRLRVEAQARPAGAYLPE